MSDDARTSDLDAVVEELAVGRRGYHRIPQELSADEAAEVWQKMLQTFLSFVMGKLEALGVATRKKPRRTSSTDVEA